MVGAVRGGFTLVETIIALLMSSLVIILVSTTFLVQNQYYSSQISRSAAHDNARAATELMATEVRSVMEDGIVLAGARTLTVRTPVVMAVVCFLQGTGNRSDVYTYGGEAAIDTDEVAGIALRDTATGSWTYATSTWQNMNAHSGQSANNCEANGADTVGFKGDFHRLRRLSSLTGVPNLGDIMMIYRETTFTIKTSEMDTTVLGLFRQVYGESAVEFATGMGPTARFQYRTSLGTYVDTVSATDLSKIDVVRFNANAQEKATTGGVDDVSYGWSINLALRNVRGNG